MKLQELFEYLKETLYTTVANALQVNHFILETDEPLLVQIPYSNDFLSKFYRYLQLRIFISSSQLLPIDNIDVFLNDVGQSASSPIEMPAKFLCNTLKDSIELKENLLFLGIRYLANDGNAAWELNLNNNILTIKDWINGWDDGSVLENYTAQYDEISSWHQKVLEHFGGYMDGQHVCLDIEINTPDDFVKGVIKYLYMTVLLASGHKYINL